MCTNKRTGYQFAIFIGDNRSDFYCASRSLDLIANKIKPVFLGVEGALTQVPPDTGFQLVVAVATSPISVLLSIKQPIVI